MKKGLLAWFSLFTSAGTLLCCALPALLVTLGMGAVFAGLLNAIPQLIWLSEHKPLVFGTGAAMLILAGWALWSARLDPCPIDPALAMACKRTRKWSVRIYFVSVGLFVIGAGFAFGSALLLP